MIRRARLWLADVLDAASHALRPSTAGDKPVEEQTLAQLQEQLRGAGVVDVEEARRRLRREQEEGLW